MLVMRTCFGVSARSTGSMAVLICIFSGTGRARTVVVRWARCGRRLVLATMRLVALVVSSSMR